MKSNPSKSNMLHLEKKSQMQNLTFALLEVKNDDWIRYQLVG